MQRARILGLLERGDRVRLLAVLGAALVVAGIEFVAAAALFALISEATTPGTGLASLAALGPGEPLARALFEGPTQLARFALLVVGVFLLKAAFGLLRVLMERRVLHHIGVRLSVRMVRAYLEMPYVDHLARGTADLVRNSHLTVREVVNQGLARMLELVTAVATAVALVAVIAITSVQVALGVTGLLGLLAVLLILVVQPRLKRLGRRSHALERDVLATLQETFSAIREVRLSGSEGARLRRFERFQRSSARLRYRAAVLKEVPRVGIEVSVAVGLAVLVIASSRSEAGATAAIPLLGLLSYVALRLQPAIKQIASAINHFRFLSAPVEDLARDLRQLSTNGTSYKKPVDRSTLVSGIRLKGVSFQYRGAGRPSLEGVDLWLPAGGRIGVVGPTGGGKSTLVDLLAGLLEPSAGRIEVDDRELKVPDRAWYAAVGVVSQLPVIFDDTLEGNIALGVRREDIDVAAMSRAVEMAQLDELVAQLPDGLDTPLGETGNRLSGGERQRIAIARALYRQPRLLILDEATSALDEGTERRLVQALADLGRDVTVVLVSHRPAPLDLVDTVVRVEDGRVVTAVR
jgi:ABC-type multidrug transport system fused ATPase/permease subunit